MISTNAIQLQFLLNQASLSVRFNIIKRRMDANPQGNIKKVEGLVGWIAIVYVLLDRKVNNIRDKIKSHPAISKMALVASTGIEPVSGASETLILSIVRRGLV